MDLTGERSQKITPRHLRRQAYLYRIDRQAEAGVRQGRHGDRRQRQRHQ